MTAKALKSAVILEKANYELIYGPQQQAKIASMTELVHRHLTPEQVKAKPSLLASIDVVFSGWGSPRLDDDFMNAAPNLKLFLYAAGSIRGLVTDAFWARNIPICSAWGANAVPVSEYTLAQILLCLKCGYRHIFDIKQGREKGWQRRHVPGAYNSNVGIISLGMIGRRVCELLRPFDLNILAYDPFVSAEVAAELGAELCSLEDVFKRSNVVSLHTPNLPETRGMITGEHFAMMRQNSAFINSARGAVVREDEMIEVLAKRPDIQAVLDVTAPHEPPKADSLLYTLANVVLTPHIAGSMDSECHRHVEFMLDELKRYMAGQPLRWSVSQKQSLTMA